MIIVQFNATEDCKFGSLLAKVIVAFFTLWTTNLQSSVVTVTDMWHDTQILLTVQVVK